MRTLWVTTRSSNASTVWSLARSHPTYKSIGRVRLRWERCSQPFLLLRERFRLINFRCNSRERGKSSLSHLVSAEISDRAGQHSFTTGWKRHILYRPLELGLKVQSLRTYFWGREEKIKSWLNQNSRVASSGITLWVGARKLRCITHCVQAWIPLLQMVRLQLDWNFTTEKYPQPSVFHQFPVKFTLKALFFPIHREQRASLDVRRCHNEVNKASK